MIAREAEIEPVETRSSKRASKRDAPYDKDQTLQERLQQQASYGKTKAPQARTVRFQDDANSRLPESKPEAKFKDRKVIKILRRLRQSRIKTLSKLSYTYERSLNKLLDQTTLLPSFTLREIISLTDPAFIKRLLSLIEYKR